jgi:large conductance mechanosensitive channel
MVKEFKDFIMRGNVLDLAVAVIIGGAFGKIISSLVADVIMPPIGLALGGVDFSDLSFILKEAVVEEGAVTAEAVSIRYGAFIQTILDFLIIALAIFMVIKAYNSTKKKEEEAPAAPPEPSNEEKLLAEIRDLLKK